MKFLLYSLHLFFSSLYSFVQNSIKVRRRRKRTELSHLQFLHSLEFGCGPTSIECSASAQVFGGYIMIVDLCLLFQSFRPVYGSKLYAWFWVVWCCIGQTKFWPSGQFGALLVRSEKFETVDRFYFLVLDETRNIIIKNECDMQRKIIFDGISYFQRVGAHVVVLSKVHRRAPFPL